MQVTAPRCAGGIWLVFTASAIVGCGRFGFDPVADVATVNPADATTARPWDGNFTMEDPVRVVELDTPVDETESIVLADSRTFFFSRTGGDSLGGNDIYGAERAGPGAPFTNIVHLTDISTVSSEGRLVTVDGLTGYFWSDRPGGVGAADIWQVVRSDTSQPFSNANATDPAVLNTTGPEYDPWPSTDGLRLYYDSNGVIVVAERPATTAAFGPPVPVAGIESPDFQDNPALSADERFITFSSTHASGIGFRDIYYARRPDRSAAFSPPLLLPVVNTADYEWEACLTEAGELFFSSNRPGGAGGEDIYRSRFIPLP